MSAITLHGLTKAFGDLVAVQHVDLDVQEGEFLVLVGPSGCGKSTLLRMIAGLETPTDGELFLDDEMVNHVEPANRNVAMVFQNYALYPHMSARRNMTFGLDSSETSSGETESRVAEAAEMLSIAELLDRKPAELSGGEKQRVAMGRALLRDPEVFLLDEPLSNLDAKLRDQMRSELIALHDELRTTTVYVTHDQTEAMTLGDRIAVMDEGKLQQVDDPQTVYDYPETKFVAQFIGSPRMNIVPATVSVTGNGTSGSVTSSMGRFDLYDAPSLADLERSREVELGVRPEDIHLASETDGSSDPFDAEVRLKEPMGDSLAVTATTDTDEIQFLTAPRQPFGVDDTVSLEVDLERLHLFDPETGVAIYHSDPDGRIAETPTAAR